MGKVHVNQDGLTLNGMYHLTLYADVVNLLCKNMNAVKKNMQLIGVAYRSQY